MKSSKLTLPVGLGIALVSLVILAFASPPGRRDRTEVVSKPATVERSGTGDFEPVWVSEAIYYSTESSLNGYRCRLKNISDKDITAVGLTWTATFSNNRAAQVYQSIDTRLHADIAESRGMRPMRPADEREFRSSSVEAFDRNISIAQVSLKIDFVEFADSTTLGAENSKTYKRLLLERRGAALYKNWLANIYRENPRHLEPVLEKLSGDELPLGRDMEEGGARQGASIYRNWLRELYATSGAAAVKEVLRKTD